MLGLNSNDVINHQQGWQTWRPPCSHLGEQENRGHPIKSDHDQHIAFLVLGFGSAVLSIDPFVEVCFKPRLE